MEHPKVGRGGVFRANCQQLIPNLQFTHCIMHKCMNEGKMCFGNGFGWICALNRWLMQERVQTNFCPITFHALN